MAWRFGPGPVFGAECLTASRRVQFYGSRVLLVISLLGALVTVWVSDRSRISRISHRELASVGHSFYTAMIGVELVLAVLIAPAATAGAISEDRAKGGLALLMTTDLSDREIVLGRLASRLLATLGVVACGLPVLALTTLLGGVDPVDALGGTLVVVGVACVSVALALAFSLWAGQSHEALSATYAVWFVFLLANPAWQGIMGGRQPDWLRWTNPFSLNFAWMSPGENRLLLQMIFLAVCLILTAALATLSTWKLRAATLHRRVKPAKAIRARRVAPGWLRWIGQGSPDLDDDPILWREWHRKRPSTFTRVIWWSYCLIYVVFMVISPFAIRMTMTFNPLMVMIGLLFASVGAATCLAEERVQGGLDVVLASPIDSRRIVLGKWWGAFRIVPRLAILPALTMVWLGVVRHDRVEALWLALIVVGMVLAYGGVVTSFGLLIAIYQARPGRAVAWAVACYLGMAIVYPAVLIPMFNLSPNNSLPIWPSPFFGIFAPTAALDLQDSGMFVLIEGLFFIAFEASVAVVLLRVGLGQFERKLGRIKDGAGLTVLRPSTRSAGPRGALWSGRPVLSPSARDRGPLP